MRPEDTVEEQTPMVFHFDGYTVTQHIDRDREAALVVSSVLLVTLYD